MPSLTTLKKETLRVIENGKERYVGMTEPTWSCSLLYLRFGHSGTQDGPGMPACVVGREKGKLVAHTLVPCLDRPGSLRARSYFFPLALLRRSYSRKIACSTADFIDPRNLTTSNQVVLP